MPRATEKLIFMKGDNINMTSWHWHKQSRKSDDIVIGIFGGGIIGAAFAGVIGALVGCLVGGFLLQTKII